MAAWSQQETQLGFYLLSKLVVPPESLHIDRLNKKKDSCSIVTYLVFMRMHK